MRTVFVTGAFIGVFGLVFIAAEKPPDDYSKAMKDIGAAATAANKAMTEQNYEAVSKSAVAIINAFPVVEKYWTGKADDGVKLSRTAVKAAGDLRALADIKSSDGVADAMKDLTAACGQCHMAHRERLPDGTFEIK